MVTPIKILPEISVVFKWRILCTLLLFFVDLQLAYPQERKYKQAIDSLERLLISANPDTTRVIILNSLTNYYMASNPEKGKATASDALSLARDLNYYDGQIRSLANLSFGSSITGEWAKGLDLAFQGIQLAKQHKPELEPSFSGIIGLAYQKQKNYKKILEWTLKPLHSNSFTTRSAVTERRNVPTQHDSGMLADLIFPAFQIWSCSMISSFGFVETGSIDSAFHYAIKSLDAAKDSSLPEPMTGYSYGTLAYVYMKNKQFDSSRFYFQKAKQIMEKSGGNFAVQEFNRDLAKLYSLQNQKDSVHKYASLAYEQASKMNNPLVVQDAAEMLANYYDPIDKSKALQYLRIYTLVKDSLSTVEKANQVYQLEWEVRRKEAELENARHANENRIRQNTLIGILTTVVLIAAVILYNNRQKQKTNRLLASQKTELESTLSNLKATQSQLVQSEKMASLGELTAGIAHEIQNPLNFVNNFSEVSNELIDEMLEEANKGNADEAKRIANDVKENLKKVSHHGKRADGIVKSMLQHSQTSAGQKEPTDINQLCEEYLRLSYHGLRAKDKSFIARFETSFDPTVGKINTVQQEIGRVILNLVNNAFYSINEKRQRSAPDFEGLVTVSTKNLRDRIEISVLDNGTGIPQNVLDKIFQPFFTTKPTGQGTGLGLSLSYDIVKAHGGELKVNTTEGQGTEFVVYLPK